ncbi:MAG TPA: hypothetical protein VFH66_13470 [Mycobacteriales bacterium]|nr:hypothetical protein [Mycobacteriales bacterium]
MSGGSAQGRMAAAAVVTLLLTGCVAHGGGARASGALPHTGAAASAAGHELTATQAKAALLDAEDLPMHVDGTTTVSSMRTPRLHADDPACGQRLDRAYASAGRHRLAHFFRNFALGPSVGAVTEDVTVYDGSRVALTLAAGSVPLQRQCSRTTWDSEGHHIVAVVTQVTSLEDGYIARVSSSTDGGPATALTEVMRVVGNCWVFIVGVGQGVTPGEVQQVASRAAAKMGTAT